MEDECPAGTRARRIASAASVTGWRASWSVASILYSRGSGESGIAVRRSRLTGMTTRTVYRDINALDESSGVPVFQADRGRYGIDEGSSSSPRCG